MKGPHLMNSRAMWFGMAIAWNRLLCNQFRINYVPMCLSDVATVGLPKPRMWKANA